MKVMSWKEEEKCVDCKNCIGTRFDKVYCKVFIDDVTRLLNRYGRGNEKRGNVPAVVLYLF